MQSCYLVLKCYSPDEGVTLSWQYQPPDVITFNSNQTANTIFLLAFINTTQDVNITCMARNDMENTSRVITKDCGGKILMSKSEKSVNIVHFQ